MGTYTTNYQLFIPTVGEQGWGTLVNGNFTTIDTTMKGLDTRLTAVENEVNGALSCTSVTTSGTITSAGLITANGGVKGNLTGNATTATNLSRTVTVGVSSTEYSVQLYSDTMLLPYTPGVLYTGKIKGYITNTSLPATLYKLSSSNTWSTATMNATSYTEYSFSNLKCMFITYRGSGSASCKIYLPTFT